MPRLVVTSWAERVEDGEIQDQLLLRDDGIEQFRKSILDLDVALIVHNAPFDCGVFCNEDATLVPFVFDAYRAHRIRCTIVRQKLIDIALGMRKFRRLNRNGEQIVVKSTYGLDDLVKLYFNIHLEKEDTWRKSYGLLDGFSLDRWPEEAKQYALADARWHLEVYDAQERHIADQFGEEYGGLPNQVEQQMASWALHLMGSWGVRADAVAVDKFVANCEVEIDKMRRDLAGTGIFQEAYRCAISCGYTAAEPWTTCPRCGRQKCVRNRDEGKRVMSEIQARVVAACERLSMKVPMTEPTEKFPEGQVQTDKEALENTDDPALHVLAEQMSFAKHLGQWKPVCEAAVLRPVCARYEVLVDSGRTSCSGSEGQESTNFQNPPRKGDVRPCFVPRDGRVLCFSDADTIELRALAQCTLEIVGWSRMAEALVDQFENAGPDLHVRLAANIENISFDEAHVLYKTGDMVFRNARQLGKHANFGLAGGMGAAQFVALARGFDIKLAETFDASVVRAGEIREIWFDTWPEMRDYFTWVSRKLNDEGYGDFEQAISKRLRGKVKFCAGANTMFQGRVADAFKECLFLLADESYTGRCTGRHQHGGSALCTVQGRSILEGSRTILHLHDEPIMEHLEDGQESERAERQRQVVVESLSRWMPDIPCTSTAVLARRWQKGADPVYVNGKLVPSKPEIVVSADGKQKLRWIHDVLGVA